MKNNEFPVSLTSLPFCSAIMLECLTKGALEGLPVALTLLRLLSLQEQAWCITVTELLRGPHQPGSCLPGIPATPADLAEHSWVPVTCVKARAARDTCNLCVRVAQSLWFSENPSSADLPLLCVSGPS